MQDDLLVESRTTPDQQPLVVVSYQGVSYEATPTSARIRAHALLQASGLVKAYTGLIKVLEGTAKSTRAQGFKRKVAQPTRPEDLMNDKHVQLISLIQQEVGPLPEGVFVMLGYSSKNLDKLPKRIVGMTLGETEIRLDADIAEAHASILLEAAEAAETDSFFYKFLLQDVGANLEEAVQEINAFRMFRDQNRLEDLFRDS